MTAWLCHTHGRMREHMDVQSRGNDVNMKRTKRGEITEGNRQHLASKYKKYATHELQCSTLCLFVSTKLEVLATLQR